MPSIYEWFNLAAQSIEALAVLIMVAFIIVGTVRWLLHSRKGIEEAYGHYRAVLGKALLVGLELLVAADIIRTVALETTLTNLAILGLLVVVRTALGWTLTVEVEGHWPWHAGKRSARGGDEEAS